MIAKRKLKYFKVKIKIQDLELILKKMQIW